MDSHPEVTGVRSVVPSIRRINSIMNYSSVPYAAAAPEPDQTSFDFFGDGGLFGSGDGTGTGTGLASGGRGTDDSGAGDTPIAETAVEPGITWDEMASMLDNALLGAGVNADAPQVIRAFLAQRNYHGSAFDEVPADPAKYGLSTIDDLHDLITQYLVLYSGNLDMFINDSLEPDRTLIAVQINDESRDVLMPLRSDITAFWNHYMPAGWSVEIAGPSTLVLVLSELVTRSQYFSLIGALVIVFAIVAITFRSPLAGVFGLIPVIFALVGIFLSMAVFGFHLDVVTSILAALAIGIGVDYGIHLMSAYRRALAHGRANPLEWVYRRTGSAILFNATSVAVGFLALLVSQFVPIRQVGILFTVSMVFAGAASLIVLPMALDYFSPRFISAGGPANGSNRRRRRSHETESLVAQSLIASTPADDDGSGGNGRRDHAESDGYPERLELGDGHPDDAGRS